MGMMDSSVGTPLRVAIIGAGFMAREHIRAFASLPGVKLAGIYSRTRARAEALAAEFAIPQTCDSVAELYASTRADLVVVTVVELEMQRVAMTCFEFPWTVMLEKPAGYNYEDAHAIALAARAKQAKVFVALNRRSYASTRYLQAAIAANPEPRFIKIQDQEDPAQALSLGQPALVVQNWMYANSIHLIDLFRVFGRGRITSVQTVVPWTPHKPGMVVSHLAFESGDRGLYEGYWNMPAPWAVSVTLSTERWELRPIEQVSVQKRGERRQQLIEQDKIDVDYKAGLKFQAEAAIAATRGEPHALATLEDALESMHLTGKMFGLI